MTTSDAGAIVARLADPKNAIGPSAFPSDPHEAARPGMYSWWGDDAARSILGTTLDCELPPLLYVGQAGATKWPSGKRSAATLASRIGSQHIRGNARSSTFRLTISVLLLDALGLQPGDGGKLEAASNRIVTAWIRDHLQVAIAPFDDRDTLGAIESEVVKRLDPPLNLDHCLPDEVRGRLKNLRRALRR